MYRLSERDISSFPTLCVGVLPNFEKMNPVAKPSGTHPIRFSMLLKFISCPVLTGTDADHEVVCYSWYYAVQIYAFFCMNPNNFVGF